MFRYLAKKRETRKLARELAISLVENAGNDAYSLVRTRIVDRITSGEDVTLECSVKREIERLLGMAPHVDTATRYLEANKQDRR